MNRQSQCQAGIKTHLLAPLTHVLDVLLLSQIASYLNRLTSDLEAAAYPALDSLTSRVTSHNLERVRRIKSRLVRLTTRVENVSVWDLGWGPCRSSDEGLGHAWRASWLAGQRSRVTRLLIVA